MTPLEWRTARKISLSEALNVKRLGLGLAQAGNLIKGFDDFIGLAYKEFSRDTPARAGDLLDCTSEINIPPEIDYRQFDSQSTKTGGKTYPYQEGPQRLWVYPCQGNLKGLLLYFDLPPEAKLGDDKVERIKDLIKGLEKITQKGSFSAQPKPLSDKLPVAPKRKPGAPPLLVQRKAIETRDIPDPTLQTAWSLWRTQFENWNTGAKGQSGAQAFLKDKKGAFWPLTKLAIDKTLNIPTSLSAGGENQKNLEKVERWSRMGKVLGWFRFKFSWLFRKIGELVGGLGKRLSGFHKSVGSAKIGGGSGWEGKALGVIKEVFVYALRLLVEKGFELVSHCIQGIIGKIFDSLIEEVREGLDEVLKGIHDKFEAFLSPFVTAYEWVVSKAETALNAIQDFLRAINILAEIEKAVRLLVQAISCVTPPALGCLWGLVSQLAFSEIASEAVDSNLFKNKIARPVAKRIMEASLGKLIRGLLEELLKKTGLEGLAKGNPAKGDPGVPDCLKKIPSPSAGEMQVDSSFHSSDPEVARIRGQIERTYSKEKMTQDLQQTLKATPEHIQDLVDIIHTSGKSPDEIKKIVEQSRARGEKGIDVARAEAQLSRLASLSNADVLAALERADWKKVVKTGEFIVDESQSQPFLLGKFPDGVRIGAPIQIKSETIGGRRVYRIIDSSDLVLLDKSDRTEIEVPLTIESGKLPIKSFSFGPFDRGYVLLTAGELRGTRVTR